MTELLLDHPFAAASGEIAGCRRAVRRQLVLVALVLVATVAGIIAAMAITGTPL